MRKPHLQRKHRPACIAGPAHGVCNTQCGGCRKLSATVVCPTLKRCNLLYTETCTSAIGPRRHHYHRGHLTLVLQQRDRSLNCGNSENPRLSSKRAFYYRWLRPESHRFGADAGETRVAGPC